MSYEIDKDKLSHNFSSMNSATAKIFGVKLDKYESQLRQKINTTAQLRETYASMISRQGQNHQALFPPRIGEKLQ